MVERIVGRALYLRLAVVHRDRVRRRAATEGRPYSYVQILAGAVAWEEDAVGFGVQSFE